MSAGCGVSSFAHNEKNIRCITDDHNTSNILKRGVVVYNRVVLVRICWKKLDSHFHAKVQ